MTTATQTHTEDRRTIKLDYLSGHSSLQPFYTYGLGEIDFAQIRDNKRFPAHHREVLVQVLEEQYGRLPEIAAVKQSLKALALPETHSLTTGHQLNIMGGPLYTPYKVLTVAKLARQLTEQDPAHPVVPVFWIHTEDHDFAEINHYYADFGTKKTYPAPFATATGHHVLEASVEELIPPHFSEILREAYSQGNTLAEATLRFAHDLYGPYGVLILDADHPSLKALFASVLERELFGSFSEAAVNSQSEALEKAGYPAQVHSREINLFWLDEQGRDRMLKVPEGFAIDGREGTLSEEFVKKTVAEQPERFSPNVILRPLYQETILPNLAYCGGWGELAYWMQLKGVFDEVDTAFPLLLPRFSATLFPEKELAEWLALDFEPADIRKELHALYRGFMPQVWDNNEFDHITEEVHAAIDRMVDYLGSMSDTLPRSAVALQVKNARFFKNMEKKIHRLVREQQPEPFEKIRRLKQAVNPDGYVQERILGLASFPDHGPQDLVASIYEKLDPLSFEHTFIQI